MGPLRLLLFTKGIYRRLSIGSERGSVTPIVGEVSSFVLPRGSVGGAYTNAAEIVDRKRNFVVWAQTLVRSLGPRVELRPLPVPAVQSFDGFELHGVGAWLVHNRFVGLVGMLETEPVAGDGWAVDGWFVDVTTSPHLDGWGPVVVPARDLNAELEALHWSAETLEARRSAQRYSPTRVGQVLFNYWD